MLRRFVCTIFLFAMTLSLAAQQISHYEYWIDDNYAGRTSESSAQEDVFALIEVKDMPVGLHFFNFRATNSEGETSAPYRYLFYIPERAHPEASLATYEYWTDNDYAGKKTGTVSSDNTFSLDVSEYSTGLHFFNFRARNTVGEYSQFYRYLFYVPEIPKNEADLASYEYWIDDEYSTRTVGEASESNVFNIDVSEYSTGLHFFNFRAINTVGEYSQFYRYLFYVPEIPSPSAQLSASEYWIDDDYEGRTFIEGDNTEQVASIDVGDLNPGLHFFNFRAFLNDGSVGTLTRLLFYIPDNQGAELNTDIVGYSYSFNSLDTYVEVNKGSSFELSNITIPIPDIKDYGTIDKNCVFTFSSEVVKMERTTNACFIIRFVNESGGWSTPETFSFTEQDSITKPFVEMPIQKSIFLKKVARGDYQAVKFTLPSSGKYYFRSSQSCDMDIYNAAGKFITTIPAAALKNTYAAQLVSGDYYGIVYNTIKDADNDEAEVALRVMTTNNTVPTPEISFADGIVSITCQQDDATIYYTLDNTNPTAQSTRYDKPFALSHNAVIKAVGMAESYSESNVAKYVVNSYKVAEPTIEFANLHIYIRCETPEAKLYFTTDGTDPLENGRLYESPISVSQNCQVKAVAIREGYNNSDIVVYDLDITSVKCVKPELSVMGNLLTMTTLTNGATIYYTTDGEAPTANSEPYHAPILLDHNATYKAIAMKDGEIPSDVAEMTIDWFQAETPKLKLEDGVLTMTCNTPGSVIYYTIGDEMPTIHSNRYTQPVALEDNSPVRAFAVAEGFNDSEVVTFRPNSFSCAMPEITFDGHAITLTSSTPEAQIYYTLNGSNPTSQSSRYDGVFIPDGLCTVKAVAIKEDMNNSDVLTYTLPCFYNGDIVYVGEPGYMEKAFEWCGLPKRSELTVSGRINDADFSTLRKMSELSHLDLSGVSVSAIGEQALAATNLVSVSMPSGSFTCGSKILAGCTRLAAIEWNATCKVPDDILGGMKLPNLLLYVKSASLASGAFKNVVIGSQAEEITLSDTEGSNFYCPREFTARQIAYSHIYTQKTVKGQCTGWESIALPFEPTSITHPVNGAMSPFAANVREYKPFWLCSLTANGFVSAPKIEANTPYIIAMPNNEKYSDEYILAGEITFSGQNVQVHSSKNIVQHQKDGYIFSPNFVLTDKSSCMTLNVGVEYEGHLPGSLFASHYRDAKPFEACVLTPDMMSSKLVWMIEGTPTGLYDWSIPEAHAITITVAQSTIVVKGLLPDDIVMVYDLSGQLITSQTSTASTLSLEYPMLKESILIVRVLRNNSNIQSTKVKL